MLKKKLLILISAITILLSSGPSFAICPKGVLQFIGGVNWDSILPISIGGITLFPSVDGVATIDTISTPVCACPFPPPIFIRPGVSIGYWEPARFIETVMDPYCFPSLGLQTDFLSGLEQQGAFNADTMKGSMNAHYFIYPIGSLLEVASDFMCVETSGFDVAYITEVDPLWQDDLLTAYINPESILFANPVAQLACMADSVSAAVGLSLSPLFWCMGSWGSAYPLTGQNVTGATMLTTHAAAAARMIYKLGRELLLWDTNVSLCSAVPTPIWIKHNYKMHLSAPVRDFTTHPIGRPPIMWETLKLVPGQDRDFIWMLFRRRACCAF